MATVESQPIPPPPVTVDITIRDKDGNFIRFSPVWMQWFNTLSVKAVGINADIAAIGLLSGQGFLTRMGSGNWAVRTHTGTPNRIDVSNGTGVGGNPTYDISATYVGQTSITTLGTIGTGVWNGTTIAIANGGTGATTAAGARTNLGATTVGANVFTVSNPGAITFLRVNLDNTVDLVTVAANTFPARGSTGSLEAKPITDGALAILAGSGSSAQFLRADGVASEELINTSGTQTFGLDGYGGHANFRGRRYNGTVGTPTPLLSANLIFALSAAGYDGSIMSGAQARVSFLASEDWSGTNRGTEISFATTPAGSAAMGTQFYMSSTNFRPSTNGTHTLGTSGLRWHEAYFDTGYTTTQAPLTSDTTVATTEYVDDAVAASGGGGLSVIAKLTTTTRNSTAVLADDPDLQVPLTGGDVYLIEARIWFKTANATMDYQFAFAYTGTMPDMPRWAVSAGPGGVGAMTAGMSETGAATNSYTVATSGLGYAYYDFVLSPSTSGTFSYQWAQRISDAGNCQTLKGSNFKVIKIS